MPTFGRPRIATRIASSPACASPSPGQQLDDPVEQVARAVAVERRERKRVAQPELVELDGVEVAARVVDLVREHEHRLLRARSVSASSSSPGRDPVPGVDDEEDEVGLLDRGARLLRDRGAERVGREVVDAARVDQQEVLAVPVGDQLLAVARHTGRLVDDGLPRLGQPVDQRRLAHVREADDRDGADDLRGRESTRSSRWGRFARAAERVDLGEPGVQVVDPRAGSRPRPPGSPWRPSGDPRSGSARPTRPRSGGSCRASTRSCRRSRPERPGHPPGSRPSPRPAAPSPGTPVSWRVPSTKRPSARPSRTTSRIRRTASRSDSPRRTAIVPKLRISWPRPGIRWASTFATKWIDRGDSKPNTGGSIQWKWLTASTTPPVRRHALGAVVAQRRQAAARASRS